MTTFGDGVYQYGGVPVGAFSSMDMFAGANDKIYFVDADNGSDGNDGLSPSSATKTIQQAIDLVSGAGAVIYIFPRAITALATDPVSYEETLIIGNDTPMLSLVGVRTGLSQGGLPQIKDSTATEPILSIQAPGCVVRDLGFNGAGNTGGSIELVDDGGTTYVSFGTVIKNCHFKNAKSSGNASTGGAIQWTSDGGAWQVHIADNRFYNCRAGIVLIGTSGSVPQDVVIENCDFTSSVNTNVDADIYIPASGIIGLMVKKCNFGTVDVPAYASSPAAARYISLGAGTKGSIMDCNFAAISQGTSAKTWGASGDAAIIPTTVRMGGCHGEAASDATGDAGDIFRT